MARHKPDQPGDPLVAIGDPQEWTDLEPYREFVRLGSEGQAGALVTILDTRGSAPRGMGTAMTVRGDGTIVGTVGGGNLEQLMISEAMEAIKDGRPRRYHYDFSRGPQQNIEKACVGTTDFLIQPFVPQPHMVIFGAGHISQALAPMGLTAGFRVSVLDDRPGYPESARFPTPVRLMSGSLSANVETLVFGDATYIVVVTHGHEKDEEALKMCLHRSWRYLGMIGSRAKVAQLFARLGTQEATREQLARVCAPIGLPIGGRTPGEIAVGIIAEIVSVRYGRQEQ